MATKNTAIFVQTPKVSQVTIVNADASNQKVLVTAGADGSKVTGVQLCSDDTGALNIQLVIKRSTTSILLGTVNVPTLAGTNGAAPAVNAFSPTLMPGLPRDADGQPYVFLQSGDTLEIKSLTTVTAAKTVSATAIYADF